MTVDQHWKKMPCSWQTDPEFHKKIKAAPVGTAIAALKLYLGLCLKANFNPSTNLPSTGCAKRTITQLCELIDMSRPMVIKGLRWLEQEGVVEKLGTRPAIYHIRAYEKPESKYWTKLPKAHLYGSHRDFKLNTLNTMGRRGKNVLHALQLYLYLAAVRDKKTGCAKVTYYRITTTLDIDRNEVSKAISTLVNQDLITVRLDEADPTGLSKPSNIYWLRGSLDDPADKDEVSRKMRVADQMNSIDDFSFGFDE